jgi:rRNA processing protein Krr1/Pno1
MAEERKSKEFSRKSESGGGEIGTNDAEDIVEKTEQARPKKRPRKNPSLVSGGGERQTGEGNDTVTYKFQISADKVGQVLGSKGAVITRLQNRSGCHIAINQDFPPGVPREVTLLGTSSQIQLAYQLIQIILEQGPAAVNMLDGPIVSEELPCPQKIIGKVIGSSGHTIKEIELQCGVKIQIHQDLPEGADRLICVTGNPSAVARARELLQYVMANGSLGPLAHADTFLLPTSAPAMPPTIPLLPPQAVQVVECPKSCLGRIIGRGGETINQIQTQSLTKIHIEQNVPPGSPCRIHITGDLSAIALAVRALREVAVGPPRHSSAVSTKPVASSLPVLSLIPDPQPMGTNYAVEPLPPPLSSDPGAPPLPPHWTEHLTEEGHVYWHNSLTSVSQVSSSPPPPFSFSLSLCSLSSVCLCSGRDPQPPPDQSIVEEGRHLGCMICQCCTSVREEGVSIQRASVNHSC